MASERKFALLKILTVGILIALMLQGVITEAEENGTGVTDFSVLQPKLNPKLNKFTVYFYLSKSSNISLKVTKGTKVLGTLINKTFLAEGSHVISWNGRIRGNLLSEGKYEVEVSESNFTKKAAIAIFYLAPPKIQTLNLWPKSVTPGPEYPRQSQGIFFSVSEKARAVVEIKQNNVVRKVLLNKELPAGKIKQVWWDGKDASGNFVKPGAYTVQLKVSNSKGSNSLSAVSNITATDNIGSDLNKLSNMTEALFDRGKISLKVYNRYVGLIKNSESLLNSLKAGRKYQEYIDLSYVIRQTASSGIFNKSHNYLMELNLRKNVDFYRYKSSPIPWTPFEDMDDTFVYIYFRDRGLQPHPVATILRISKINDDARFIKSLNKMLSSFTTQRHNAINFKTILYQFEYLGGRSFWPSAMSQGMILPSIARAYRLTGKKAYYDQADLIMNSFMVSYKYGGVLDRGAKGKDNWYLEYAFSNDYRVLNGTVISLQGLKSYTNATGNLKAKKLFVRGLDQVNKVIQTYDHGYTSGGSWSKYCNIQYPASDHYHLLNTILVEWATKNKDLIGRGEILAHFAKSWRKPIVRLSQSNPKRFDESRIWEGLVITYEYGELPGLNDQPLF